MNYDDNDLIQLLNLIGNGISSSEFKRNLAQSYIDCERELMQLSIEYSGHDIDVDAPCFKGVDEWIIIKNGKCGEFWEKMNPMIFLARIPKELIYDILDNDFISVFDALICVGFNSGYLDAMEAVSHSVETFIDELSSGNIIPRNPATKKKWKPGMAKMMTPGFPKIYPDLSWVLSFEEAEEWAVKSFATSLKALRERIGAKLDNSEHSEKPNKPELPHEPTTKDKPELKDTIFDTPKKEEKCLRDDERGSLLTIIAAMSERLSIHLEDEQLAKDLTEIAKNKLKAEISLITVKRHLKASANRVK